MGQYHLDKVFQDLYKAYIDEDLAPKAQHALPNTTVLWIATAFHQASVRLQTTAALIILAYFFLLRVGEYTESRNTSREKRTIPLRKCDVTMLQGDQRLDRNAPLSTLLTATGCTICLENQKNGVKDQTLYHDASGQELLCPVRAMAHLLYQIRDRSDDTPLGSFTENGKLKKITANAVLAAVRLGASEDHLDSAGYDMTRIGTHSLRASGAVRLKLAGADDGLIKRLGRWSGDTYQRYIQPYIGPITGGCAARMAKILRFVNVHVR